MKTLHVTGRNAWRKWLQTNGGREKEIWLVFYKKHTGRAQLAYDDAVEEALCFGWIDSIVKRMDGERYARKFTPRKLGSRWSELNISRAKKMVAAGSMTAAGLALIDPALLKRRPPPSPLKPALEFKMPSFILDGLAADPVAWAYYQKLAPSYRRLYIDWVSNAKKEETRQKRLAEMLATLRAGRKLGLK